MYSDGDLDAAVAAGALSSEAAERLRAHVAQSRQGSAADEEHFRLLTGFNDIFVSIAIVMILASIAWIGHGGSLILTSGSEAVVSWGLAEFFTRRRRMALPSILLLLSFTYAVGVAAVGTFFSFAGCGPEGWRWVGNLPVALEWPALAAAAVTTFAVYLHWRRFMVPITVAAGMATLVATVLIALEMLVPDLRGHVMALLLLAGLGVFAVAMWWDGSDPARRTRRSDVAFWLHLMAAPMMVHPAFALLGILGHGEIAPGRAVAVMAIYLVLAFVALAIDRRALLVSALAYVLTAMSTLFKAVGSAGFSFALTVLVIGSLLLLLSAFWHNARRPLVAMLPTGLRRRLPAV